MLHPGLFRKYMHAQDSATWKHPAEEMLFLQGTLIKYGFKVNNHLDTSVQEASRIFQM